MIGTIHENKLFFSINVGDGTTDSGKKFNLAVGAGNMQPHVTYGKRTFELSWEEIIELAEQAGLFIDKE